MRATTKTTLLIALAATGLGAGCGSEEQGEPIPAQQAAELEKRLDSVQGRIDFGGGACDDIAEDEQLVAQTIATLPGNVDPDVRQALEDGFDRLFTLTADQCGEQQGQDTTPQDTTETEPPPTETEPPPTETEPPPTETEPPPTTTEPPPTDEGDGDSGTPAPEEDG